jgi:hypothetical protein
LPVSVIISLWFQVCSGYIKTCSNNIIIIKWLETWLCLCWICGGLSSKARIFFPEFNIRLYNKNSESDYFFFSTKIRIFFSATLRIRMVFTPLPFKLNGRSLKENTYTTWNIIKALRTWKHFFFLFCCQRIEPWEKKVNKVVILTNCFWGVIVFCFVQNFFCEQHKS